jgi:hypothetical protein
MQTLRPGRSEPQSSVAGRSCFPPRLSKLNVGLVGLLMMEFPEHKPPVRHVENLLTEVGYFTSVDAVGASAASELVDTST